MCAPVLNCSMSIYIQYTMGVYLYTPLCVFVKAHLSVSLMPYSIRPQILCVQLIARTSAGVCVFPTLENRSMATHTNVPPC